MDESRSYAAPPVAAIGAGARAEFVANTYIHLMGAIVGFVIVEMAFFATGLAESMTRAISGAQGSWLLVLGGFLVVNWLASRVAHTAESKTAQYGALGAFVVAQALIFAPLLYIAQNFAKGGVIESAALVTLLGFAGLTGVAWVTRKDFSFLRGILIWGGVGAMLLIVGGVAFGFQLGTFFSVGMIVFAGAAILYDTSNIIHHYPEDRYVGAALQLFASVALMFWYVLRLFMARD